MWGGGEEGVNECMCLCEREREREIEGNKWEKETRKAE